MEVLTGPGQQPDQLTVNRLLTTGTEWEQPAFRLVIQSCCPLSSQAERATKGLLNLLLG
jgi:hypothetical protein